MKNIRVNKIRGFLTDYFRITLPLLTVFILFRIFEFLTAGIKLTFGHGVILVLLKCIYFDISTWLIYSALLLLPFLLLCFLHKKTAQIFLHAINILVIFGFFGLLIVFSERLVPFDHELFVRHIRESFSTVVEVITGRYWIVLPIMLYLAFYVTVYRLVFSKIRFTRFSIVAFLLLMIFFGTFFRLGLPSLKNYEQIQEYYLVSNSFIPKTM